ncbi:hypothetical protein ACKGJO_06500 [Gracilimonas sp. Q87]|uniref:hypothetical protein n=1 Tax=Gracilimonas sp. Q87 TaxID=3384766 RepID=UPI00398424F6
MKLITIENKISGQTYVGTEPSKGGRTLAKFFDLFVQNPNMCPELTEDIKFLGKKKFDVSLVDTNDSGESIALQQKELIDELGDGAYNEPHLYNVYFKTVFHD